MTWILIGLGGFIAIVLLLFLQMVSRVRSVTLPYTLHLHEGAVAERSGAREVFAALGGELGRLGFVPVREFVTPDLKGNVVNAAYFQAQPPTFAVVTEVEMRGQEGQQRGHALTLTSALDDGRVVQTTTRPYPSVYLAADFLLEVCMPGARPTRLFVHHVERLQALLKKGGAVAPRSAAEFGVRHVELWDRLQQRERAAGMRSLPQADGRVRLTWTGAVRLTARSLLRRVK